MALVVVGFTIMLDKHRTHATHQNTIHVICDQGFSIRLENWFGYTVFHKVFEIFIKT
jgi:hypothetical protein